MPLMQRYLYFAFKNISVENINLEVNRIRDTNVWPNTRVIDNGTGALYCSVFDIQLNTRLERFLSHKTLKQRVTQKRNV